jgi:hypothetical protein
MIKSSLLVLTGILTFVSFAQTDIFTTDFQSGIPVNYSIVNNDGLTPNSQVSNFSNAWIALQDPENNLDTIVGSTSFFEPEGTASRWLITPPFALGAYGNLIEWEAKSHDASFPDNYMILVSTTDNQISSFTDTVGYFYQESFEWITREINLSLNGYNNQTVYVAFVNTTQDGFVLYIDDIHAWKEDPVGLTELAVSNVSVYPNPTNDFIKVETMEQIKQLRLMTLNGDVLINSTMNELSLSSYTNGIYLLHIETDKGVSVKRVVKN